MIQDTRNNTLVPFEFDHLYKLIPELEGFDLEIKVQSFSKPIDSSDMNIESWQKIATMIEKSYHNFDGFVILHGSDTMAYTASALSFMFENLAKPVILTGSQLPIGMLRTDGKENLITAIEIAASRDAHGNPLVKEVCVYFEYKLYRGNRTHKFNAEHFDAFKSANYPVLAEAGISIDFKSGALWSPKAGDFIVKKNMDPHIGVLKLYPGISREVAQAILSCTPLKAIILETFGSGNGPTAPWFIDMLAEAIEQRGLIVLNVSQCNKGSVQQGRYATSKALQDIGVVGGYDITFEAAITKLMHLCGNYIHREEVISQLLVNMRGEITITAS